jgi:hypothetical protein
MSLDLPGRADYLMEPLYNGNLNHIFAWLSFKRLNQHMSRTTFYLIVILLMVSIVSCKKDDEVSKKNGILLSRTWKCRLPQNSTA